MNLTMPIVAERTLCESAHPPCKFSVLFVWHSLTLSLLAASVAVASAAEYLIAPSAAMHETIACEAMRTTIKMHAAIGKDKSDPKLYDPLVSAFGNGLLVLGCDQTVSTQYVMPRLPVSYAAVNSSYVSTPHLCSALAQHMAVALAQLRTYLNLGMANLPSLHSVTRVTSMSHPAHYVFIRCPLARRSL